MVEKTRVYNTKVRTWDQYRIEELCGHVIIHYNRAETCADSIQRALELRTARNYLNLMDAKLMNLEKSEKPL